MTTIFKLVELIDDKLELTDKGYFFKNRASSYGVTTSYLPLLNSLDKLISKKVIVTAHKLTLKVKADIID